MVNELDGTTCDQCYGTTHPLGMMGKLMWYRCPACGWTQYDTTIHTGDDDVD